VAGKDSEGWISWEDRLIPLEEVSDSLRDALRQRPTPDGRAFATAEAADGTRYTAGYMDGTVFIDRLPYGRISIPLPEPPGLKWEPETAYWLKGAAGEDEARNEGE